MSEVPSPPPVHISKILAISISFTRRLTGKTFHMPFFEGFLHLSSCLYFYSACYSVSLLLEGWILFDRIPWGWSSRPTNQPRRPFFIVPFTLSSRPPHLVCMYPVCVHVLLNVHAFEVNIARSNIRFNWFGSFLYPAKIHFPSLCVRVLIASYTARPIW